MKDIPEFATFTKPGEKARTLRESVNGQLKFSRIPIRRRQLRYEVENFTNWIARLIQSELEMCKEDPTYPRFFSGGNTSLLIIAEDRGEIVQAEIGTEGQIKMLREIASQDTSEYKEI